MGQSIIHCQDCNQPFTAHRKPKRCPECHALYRKIYNQEYWKAYYQGHKQEIKNKNDAYLQNLSVDDKNKRKEYQRRYVAANYKRRYVYYKNPEFRSTKEKTKASRRKCYIKRRNSGKSAQSKRQYLNNTEHKIAQVLRCRIWWVLKKDKKHFKFNDVIGCTTFFLKQYLENLFVDGMSWDNYGRYGWHIDYIKPCASFDLSKPEEQKKCFHYTNLQPLWAQDNYKKGKKIL